LCHQRVNQRGCVARLVHEVESEFVISTLADEAKMYSSRQLALFNPKVQAGNEKPTGIKLDPVNAMGVPHLLEQFPDMKARSCSNLLSLGY
jgi:hypothetical protein